MQNGLVLLAKESDEDVADDFDLDAGYVFEQSRVLGRRHFQHCLDQSGQVRVKREQVWLGSQEFLGVFKDLVRSLESAQMRQNVFTLLRIQLMDGVVNATQKIDKLIYGGQAVNDRLDFCNEVGRPRLSGNLDRLLVRFSYGYWFGLSL